MKILQVHKYFTRKRGGGSVTAFFEMKKILDRKGHEVSVFSMQDENNETTPHSPYFTEHFDLNEKMGLGRKLKISSKIIYNFQAKKNLQKLIDREKPEIAHLHNFYHYLSPSIISTLKKNKIPIVMTLHDYKIICPNYKLFNKGKICEKCRGGKYYNCAIDRCLRNSFLASLLIMTEAYLHRFLKSYGKIDLFFAPSNFIKNKCVEFGIPEEKIKVIRNPIAIENIEKEVDYNLREKNYFLYYGRLSEEKGIDILIQAVSKLEKENIFGENELYIAGKGPEEKNLKSLVKELNLENRVKFLGFKLGKELMDIIRQAKFVVVPSIWQDNSPMVVPEAQIAEKSVIVSDLGGTKESIIEGETGWIFEGGNVSDLSSKIKKMLNLSQDERTVMGQKGRENILKINDSEKIYQEILNSYESLLI
jgi:glycosyltransferase involved in cell wall biosynthesis